MSTKAREARVRREWRALGWIAGKRRGRDDWFLFQEGDDSDGDGITSAQLHTMEALLPADDAERAALRVGGLDALETARNSRKERS